MEAYYSGKVDTLPRSDPQRSFAKANINDTTNFTNMIQDEKISESFDEKPFIFEVESNSTKNGVQKRSRKGESIELAATKEYEGGRI